MMSEKRHNVLETIRSNINTHGFHVTVVQGGPLPRFAYTIGLHEKVGLELVFAGGAFFALDHVLCIVKDLARSYLGGREPASIEVDQLGNLDLQQIDHSWAERLLLGAMDIYDLKTINALQITPDYEHWTIDVPDMRQRWSLVAHPVWKWLEAEWIFPVSSRATAITNLAALRGQPITEVVRWKEDEWELFAGAGPDVVVADIRRVPLASIVGFDSTTEDAVYLETGSGLWRESLDSPFHPWGPSV
jgi:hypothetical protein